MLKDKKLVAKTAQRDQRAYQDPGQYGPQTNAVLDHRHHGQLKLEEVGAYPLGDEESAMNGDCQE